MRGHYSNRIVGVQTDANACGEFRPCRHAFFEGPKRRYHLPETVGEPLVDGGLIRGLLTQDRHCFTETTFKVRALPSIPSRVVKVDDIDILNR